MRILALTAFSLVICQLAACDTAARKGGATRQEATAPPRQSLARVAGDRIFFGHQSVGFNVMAGMEALCREAVCPLKVVETTDPAAFGAPVFAHARVGRNTDPSSKLADFEEKLSAGIGKEANVVLLKFCYVDITAGTDVEKLFGEYRKTMERIRGRFPLLTVVHVTVPLTTVQKGVKARIKTLTGIATPWNYEDNIKRNRYNELLRSHYRGKEPIFDLAALTSTTPDGATESFSWHGTSYQALYPPYSSDGGHLTPTGSRRAAAGLVHTLAALP